MSRTSSQALRITAVILCGGRASRMGGADKGLLEFAGESLAARAARRISGQVDSVVVSANRNLSEYAALGFPVVEDEIGGYAGPLAGVHAAMLRLSSEELASAVLTVPCDSPFFPDGYAHGMRQALEDNPGASCAVACAGGVRQPAFALYRAELCGEIGRFLASGGRRLGECLAAHGALLVDFEDLRAFDNLNTAQELRKAQEIKKFP